jgi:hypothetical protein
MLSTTFVGGLVGSSMCGHLVCGYHVHLWRGTLVRHHHKY